MNCVMVGLPKGTIKINEGFHENSTKGDARRSLEVAQMRAQRVQPA
jgi:hypothetical protein